MKLRFFALVALLSFVCIGANAQCKGKCRNGFGTFTFEDGEVYKGNFVDGKFDGKGSYTFKSGSAYEGDYKAGIREGKGKFTYASGDVYEGDFVNGLPEGKGVYTFASGTKQTGIFENSEMIEEISIERQNKKRK